MKKIGIIGAMELEVETLKSKMNVVKTTKKANMEFFEGTLNGVGVVIVRSGIGKVNAGICTQILADLFDVTHIINTGIAGSLDAQIDIGDIVVSTDVLQHDMLSVRRDSTAWNFKFPGGRENGIPCQERVRESQHRSESVLRQDRKRRPVYL